MPLLSLLLSTTPTALPDDWPQWRGPARNGISAETGWTDEGRAAWRREVGLGYSAVSVVDGRLYTAGWDEAKGEDVVWCLDADTGEELWTHRYPAQKWDKFHGGGTNTTPAVDGDEVYVLNREGRFTCLDAESGEVRWTKDVKAEYDLEIPTWGFGASPLVLDGLVILNVGPVLAFDGKGELRWRTEGSYGHAYSTPTDCTLRGTPSLAVFNGDGLAIVALKDGSEIAFHEWKTKHDINAASPVAVGDDRVFISSGYDHGAALLELGASGLEVVWETKGMRTQMATAVLVGGHLYGLDEAQLKCFDLEGKELWRERGIGKGALSAAGDRLLVMTGDGELVVAEASPEELRELSRAKVVEGGVCWTMPVLADGRVYCRNSLGELVCRDHREQGE